MKKTLFIDMDDTIAQFIGDERHSSVSLHFEHRDYPAMHKEGYFRNQKPFKEAIDAVKKIVKSNRYEVYILSVPLASSPCSYSEKVEWIMEYLPELAHRIILTQDKGLIKGDILIDDSYKWKKTWTENGGRFIQVDPRKPIKPQWDLILKELL